MYPKLSCIELGKISFHGIGRNNVETSSEQVGAGGRAEGKQVQNQSEQVST